ncbi:MAG: 2TM domain-containing protein [Pseudomonadota bacterium]|nr:2TM domain-containing protein [Pseudomonadota bacterium]
MGLFQSATRPFSHVADAVFMPFKAVFVVGLCWIINALTYNGHWWVQWVALGMGIATAVALARGIKALLLLALVAWVGNKLYRRYGSAARQRFDDWVDKTQPGAARVLDSLRRPQQSAGDTRPLQH